MAHRHHHAVGRNIRRTLPAKQERRPADSITVNVPQGIGDIFWCYQKLSPYFSTINFNILITAPDKVQARSQAWLAVLPKVKRVVMRMVPGPKYTEVIERHHPMKTVLHGRSPMVDYSCNKPLEDGIRLEDIDPGYGVEWGVSVTTAEHPLFLGKDYITLYVSGSTKNPALLQNGTVWGVDKWVEFMTGLYAKYKLDLPVALIGADFDRDVMDVVAERLREKKMIVETLVGEKPEKVLFLMKNSKFFIGYQSGLNIMADNMDVPQFMLYFHFLEKMQYTWCKPENVNTKFKAALFTRSPQEILDSYEFKF